MKSLDVPGTLSTLGTLDNIANRANYVSIIGSMNADYTVQTERLPLPGETIAGGPLSILPGGKSSNQAVAAAKIGASVRMFGALGTDSNANFLAQCLQSAGVDVSGIEHVPGASGSTIITVDAQGENTIVYSSGSNSALTTEYVDRIKSQLITPHGVLGLCLEIPMDVVVHAATLAHEAKMTVLLNDSPFSSNLPQELIDATDILLVNEHELGQLLDIDEPENDDWEHADWSDITTRLQQYGPCKRGFTQAIITLGAAGSVVIDGERVSRVPGIRVKAIDTTGCGDAYMGTVLAVLASNARNDTALTDAAILASYVSAYAATHVGAQASYGTAQQIRETFT